MSDWEQQWQLNIDAALSKWQCEMFGQGANGVVFTPRIGQEPNWFWRFMQWACFGHKWTKRK